MAHLVEEAMAKREYYFGIARFFENKHDLSLTKFKQQIKTGGKEVFGDWDDLMEWEASNLAAKDWDRKHKELTLCLKSSRK